MSASRTLFAVLIGLLLSVFSTPAFAQGSCEFSQPIAGTTGPTGPIGFGESNRFDYQSRHTGSDWLAPAGTPVYAGADGTVMFVGDWPSWTSSPWANSIWLKVDCGGRTMFVQYVHLWDGRYQVNPGDTVAPGQVIGFVGPIRISGNGDADHVHLGITDTDPRAVEAQLVSLDQVNWMNPVDFFTGTAIQSRSNRGWIGFAVVGLAAMVLVGGFVANKNPQLVFAGIRSGQGMVNSIIRGLYWIYVFIMELPFGGGKAFRKLLLSGVFAGVLVVIPLTGLALWSTITERNGVRVYAVEPSALGPTGHISSIFTPEVQAWAPKILEWGQLYDLNENLIATVMQIESCGQAGVVSPSGAQGLFQVMPLHFASGERMLDPETNARRGINYLRQTIAAYPDDLERALAAYNGGISGVSGDPSTWSAETQKYWYWGTGIFADANSGATSSARLAEWLAIDAGYLCKSTNKENVPWNGLP